MANPVVTFEMENGDIMKAELYPEISEHLKMLSDPTKLAILAILKKEPTYQSDLAKRLSLTTATISHHMNQLYLNS